MTKFQASSPQVTKAVYTAVLFDVLPTDVGGSRDLPQRLPLLPTTTRSTPTPTTTAYCQLLAGSLVGVGAAMAGLNLLDYYYYHFHHHDGAVAEGGTTVRITTTATTTSLGTFCFALAWSCATAAAAYAVYAAMLITAKQCLASRSQELFDNNDDDDDDDDIRSLIKDGDEHYTDYQAYHYSGSHHSDTVADDDDDDADKHKSEHYFVLATFVAFCSTCTVHDASAGIMPVRSVVATVLTAAAWAGIMLHCAAKGTEQQQQQRKATTPPTAIIVV